MHTTLGELTGCIHHRYNGEYDYVKENVILHPFYCCCPLIYFYLICCQVFYQMFVLCNVLLLLFYELNVLIVVVML